MTVTIASPIAIPGILANPATLFATAFAAIAAVPNVAVRLDTRSFPIWNIPFSTPLGMPIFKIFPITSRCGFIQPGVAIHSGLSFRESSTTMTSADTIRAVSVASAAPSTPILSPKISTALPPILITFMTRLVYMLTLLFPIARNSAAPAL